MSAPDVREALMDLASNWATGSSNDLTDDTYQRAFNAARYRCAQELRAALAAPVSPPAPRGEAVEPWAWAVKPNNGIPQHVYYDRREAERVCADLNTREWTAREGARPFRVVALVPQHKEPAP